MVLEYCNFIKFVNAIFYRRESPNSQNIRIETLKGKGS